MKPVAAVPVAALGGLLVCLLATPPAVATQRWSPLVVSVDGKSWSSNLKQPVFESDLRIVPGGSVVRTIHVRNQGDRTLRVQMRVRPSDSADQRLSRQFHLAIRDDRTWHGTQAARGPERFRITSGQIVSVRVRVRLPAEAGNATRNRELPFYFAVRVTREGSSE